MLKRKTALKEVRKPLATDAAADSACRTSADGRIYVNDPRTGKLLAASRVFIFADADADGKELAPKVTVVIKPRHGSNTVEQLLDAVVAGLSDGPRMARRTLTLDADEELTLRCGKSSITLTKSGKVIVKGTKIVSRASAENKIRGAQISLN